MPKKLEQKLKKQYSNLPKERRNAAVYGTLRKTGWTPSREKKKGGK